MSLPVEYVLTNSCVNFFRLSLKKKSLGVACRTLNDQQMWLETIKKKKKIENSSQLVCNVRVRKILRNLEFLSKPFESDKKEKVGGLF